MMIEFRIRYLASVILIAVCLVALCAFTAISLIGQQRAVTTILRENVASQRAAVKLEECLTDLIALETDQVERVSVLHDRIVYLLRANRQVSDQEEELRLQQQLEAGFASYVRTWDALPASGAAGHEEARKRATVMLQTEVLEPCIAFKRYNSRRVEASAENHEGVLRRLAWGLGVIGVLGTIAGIVLGFGVANELTRSIRRLRVQIRDTVGKLDADSAEIVLTGRGEFQGLHADLDHLGQRIEAIVKDLRQREVEVLRAEQLAAVGQLAAGVAHEIRNPLTSIKLLTQSSLEDGEMTTEDLRVIDGEIRRMESSLQTFLDFARPTKLQRRSSDVVALARGVFELVRGRAEKQKVTLILQSEAETSELFVDPEQIRQVLVNLCLNALDAMPTGGTLRLTIRQIQRDEVELMVCDTGPGIAESVMGNLFQPFVSGKDTGLGLGLVLSRRILVDHGGRITAENQLEGGARFVIVLPVVSE
jgi:signal transduction histidine kinase